MHCYFQKYILHFNRPGGTSRGVLYDKETYIIVLKDGEKTAYGECNLFRNLSYDHREGYEQKLKEVCQHLPEEGKKLLNDLDEWPSIRFGVETVLRDWQNGSCQIIFPESMGKKGFTVPINGLIWMGSHPDMLEQIRNKLEEGYSSVKLKIGAIDFEKELELLAFIRQHHPVSEVEIRVDANGAFSPKEAAEKIKRLADYDVNYIEQPIKAGQWQEMAALTENTPVKIALDEELIGVHLTEERKRLIETIAPQVLILKPALVGGFEACNEWKKLIESAGGDWVITSALESNIGLNAIAQYTAPESGSTAQGLGTGRLFTNNFPSPYTVNAKGLHYHPDKKWDFSLLS